MYVTRNGSKLGWFFAKYLSWGTPPGQMSLTVDEFQFSAVTRGTQDISPLPCKKKSFVTFHSEVWD